LLCRELGVDVNRANKHGNTALVFATMRGQLGVVRLLVRKLGAKTNKLGDSALTLAALTKQKEVVKWLIRHGGADPKQTSHRGYSVPSLARLRFLMPNCPRPEKQTPSWWRGSSPRPTAPTQPATKAARKNVGGATRCATAGPRVKRSIGRNTNGSVSNGHRPPVESRASPGPESPD
jgi:hypothetical protein